MALTAIMLRCHGFWFYAKPTLCFRRWLMRKTVSRNLDWFLCTGSILLALCVIFIRYQWIFAPFLETALLVIGAVSSIQAGYLNHQDPQSDIGAVPPLGKADLVWEPQCTLQAGAKSCIGRCPVVGAMRAFKFMKQLGTILLTWINFNTRMEK